MLRSLGIDVLVDIIEKSSYGVCITGDQHTWLYLNPAGARLVGRPFEDLYGEDYLLSFAAHERDALLALEADQHDGDTGFYTNTVVRDDGTEREMTWSGTSVRTPLGELAPAIFHDTSRIRRAQREASALADAAARLAEGSDPRGIINALAQAAVATTRAFVCLVLAASDAITGDGLGPLRIIGHSDDGETWGPALVAAVEGLALPLTEFPERHLLTGRRPVLLADHRRRLLADPATAALVGGTDVPWEGSALVPLRADGRLVGVLVALLPPEVTSPSEEETEFWASLADQASAALTSARLRAQAETTAAAAERLRIGRDLHDSVSHALFVLRQRAEIIEKALDTGNEALLEAAAASLKDVSQQAITDMRALLAELRPTAAGGRDLVGDLRKLAAEVWQRHGLEVDVDVDPVAQKYAASVESRTCEHLERVAGEALHNAAKHAQASRATISLTVGGTRSEGSGGEHSGSGLSRSDPAGNDGTGAAVLRVSVRDDGRGGAPTTGAAGGHGLRTMRERMTLCGGTLTVTSEPGMGTEVTAHLPLS